jgi:hypothetical protein
VIVNQFGTLTADLVRPELLLVPTGKSTTGPPPAYAPAIDHFECFRAVRARFRRSGIDVVDQFGTRTVNVRRPTRLCVPVDKDGSGITDPTTSLMCYRVSGKPRVNRTHVFTTNQLGSDEYDVGAVRELCVPSQLNPGGPTMTPNVTATPVATETPGAAGTATPIETAAVATPTPTATPTAAGPTPTATPTQTPAVATPTPTVTLTPSATATPACGDGTCDPSEDPSSCSADCPPCTLTTTIAPSPPYFRSSQIVIDAALSESCGDSSTWSFSWMSCVDSVVVSSQSTLIFPPDTLAAGSEYCLEVSATPPVGSTVQPPSPAQVHFRIEES